ncbi:MAG: ankyrin repeat domain-containing protein [Bacteriovoracaceae bacterium]|nr:ankyrin repeat domain-containing protein [Bacteriovoracaceae bacterium]
MRLYWHFLKSNLLYNKVELSISYGLTCLVFIAYFYFQYIGSKLMAGETFVSIAFYALLYAFFSNKKKFNLKYLVSLPMPKSQMLLVKACSDIVFFLPFMALAFAGAKLSNLPVGSFTLVILLFQASVMVSLYLFDSDIEQPRLENTRASFVNRLVYVRKGLDSFFGLAMAGIFGSIIYASELPQSTKQQALVVCAFLVIGLKYFKSLKLLKNESLSYFVFKRDLLGMGWKSSLLVAPVLFVVANGGLKSLTPSPYGNNELYKAIVSNDLVKLKKLSSKGEKSNLAGYTPLLVAAQEGNIQAFEMLLNQSTNLNAVVTNKKFSGLGLSHVAALSNNPSMMDRVLTLQEDGLDLLSPQKKTPLMVAAQYCRAQMVDHLLSKGANPNLQSEKGDTALILAVKNACDSSVAVLLENKALATIKDHEGKTAFDYLNEKSTIKYLLKRKLPKEYIEAKRDLASKEEVKLNLSL